MNLVRICLVNLLFIVLSVSASSQTTPYKPAPLDQNAIVVDSTGKKYPHSLWSKLMISGDYNIATKMEGGKPTNIFLITKLSEEMKRRRNESLGKPGETPFFKTGSHFANFSFRDLNNRKYKLKEMEGKVVVLNFWFINCPPCRQEIPELNSLVEKYKGREDVVFLGIALDDASNLRIFLKKTPFNYNIVPDGRFYTQSYGVRGFPTHVVLDRKGNILFHTYGLAPHTVHWVGKTIEEALKSEVSTDNNLSVN